MPQARCFAFSVADSGSVNGDGNIINAAESITETVNIEILGFNDVPVLPVDAITLTDGTEGHRPTTSPPLIF